MESIATDDDGSQGRAALVVGSLEDTVGRVVLASTGTGHAATITPQGHTIHTIIQATALRTTVQARTGTTSVDDTPLPPQSLGRYKPIEMKPWELSP